MVFFTADYSSQKLNNDWGAHLPFASNEYKAQCAEQLAGVLVGQQTIEARLRAAAVHFGEQFQAAGVEDIVMLDVPLGAEMTADFLAPQLSPYVRVTRDQITVSRYGLDRKPVPPHISQHPKVKLAGATVLLTEDLIDEGLTVDCIVDYLVAQRVRSVGIFTLAEKDNLQVDLDSARGDVPIQRVAAFRFDNHWLGGYGMDIVVHDRDGDDVHEYRRLPLIVAADPGYLHRIGKATEEDRAALQALIDQVV